MRIALIAWEALHALPIGGVAVHVSAVAEALAQRGHHVHLFTRRGPGQRLLDRIGGVAYHRCPFEPRPAFFDEVLAFAEPLRHYLAAEENAGGPFDRLYAHDWPALPAALACLPPDHVPPPPGTPRRLAVAFHSTEWGRAGVWPERGLSARIAAFERAACQRADAVVALSGAVRRELHALYAPPEWKCAVIHQGVDPAPFDRPDARVPDAAATRRVLGLPPDAPFVLCVGRLDEARGVDRWPVAWRTAKNACPAARLVLVGDGPGGDILKAAFSGADAAGMIDAGLVFAGWRDGPALAGAYQHCAVLAAPARRDPYGQVALLAWAARRPVVAARENAAAEFVLPGVNGWIADDDEALGHALVQALDDPARADWMGANGRAAVETAFTWDRRAEQLETLFARRDRWTIPATGGA